MKRRTRITDRGTYEVHDLVSSAEATITSDIYCTQQLEEVAPEQEEPQLATPAP